MISKHAHAGGKNTRAHAKYKQSLLTSKERMQNALFVYIQ